EGTDDHDIARNDEDDQKNRHHADNSERYIDGDDQRLVGQRIKVGAKLALHVEALGEEAVYGIADACGEKQYEGDAHFAQRDRPDQNGNEQNPPQGNEIRDTQTAPKPAATLARPPGAPPPSANSSRLVDPQFLALDR